MHIYIIHFPHRCAGNSSASTQPGTVVTPPAKEVKDGESASKKRKKAPPTEHYSADEDATAEPEGVPKKTAVKAKAAPKKSSKKKTPEAPAPLVKEDSTPKTREAVKKRLQRAATVDMPNAESKDAEASEGEESSSEAPNDGPSLEEVRAKKAAHARFMRFSRSLKSCLVAIIYICAFNIAFFVFMKRNNNTTLEL